MVNYFLFAFRNLKRRGLRSWLTLIGIFIGITAVVSLISLGNGLKAAVNAQFGVSAVELISVQASGVTYGPPGSGDVNPLTREDLEAIRGLSSVDMAFGRNIGILKIEFNDKANFAYTASVPEEDLEDFYSLLDADVHQGRLLKEGETGKVVLGYNYVDGEKNGFDKLIKTGDKLTLNNRSFEVAGILEKQGSFIFDWAILMYDDEMNDLLNYGDDLDIIAVKPKSKDLMDKAQDDIEKLLRKRRNVDLGEEDFQVSTPEASLAQVNSILNGIQIFVIIIASISIVVGAIGIVNTMTTAVLERKKEIGIMKSIGAKNSQIFSQFLVESGLLGFVGGLAGVICGVSAGYIGITALNSFIGSTTKPQIDFFLIFFALFGSFIIGSVAGITPAMRAAKQNPVDSLRS